MIPGEIFTEKTDQPSVALEPRLWFKNSSIIATAEPTR